MASFAFSQSGSGSVSQGGQVGIDDFVKNEKGCKSLLNTKICYEMALFNHFMQEIFAGLIGNCKLDERYSFKNASQLHVSFLMLSNK